MDSTSDDIEIISERETLRPTLVASRVARESENARRSVGRATHSEGDSGNTEGSNRRRRRLVRPVRNSTVPERQIIDVEALESEPEEEDIEIVEERQLTPLPPPSTSPGPIEQRRNPAHSIDFVIHAPGRTFQTGIQQQRGNSRSFEGMRPNMVTRIRTRQEMERSYLQRREQERHRTQAIRERFYRAGRSLNERIWGAFPRDIGLGMGHLLFPGNINNLIFRNEDSETDEDYIPGVNNGSRNNDEEQETQFWINRVQQLENQENDERINKRMKYGNRCKEQIMSKLVDSEAQERHYFNTIKEKKKPICTQCGVELGDGIPADFQKSSKTLVELVRLRKSPAPYEYNSKFSESDILNSKKIFYSKNCGHLFCGRCIQFFKRGSKSKKAKAKKIKIWLNEDADKDRDDYFEIYDDYTPVLGLSKCCGYKCGANLYKFCEIYF